MTVEPPPAPRMFILIQDDPVISMDLVSTLEMYFPNSVTHLFDQVEAAAEAFESSVETASILISSSLVTSAALELFEDIIARGAKVVVIGASEAVGFAAAVNTPFSTKMILDVLS